MFITLVSATAIKMISHPSEFVNIGDTAEISCETDEANPTASITWIRQQDQTESISGEDVPGSYDSNKRKATLSIQVAKEHNNKQYKCQLKNGGSVISEKEYTLQVKCELLLG